MMKHQRLQSCDFGKVKHVGTSIQEWSRENYVILLAGKMPQTKYCFKCYGVSDCYLFCSDKERNPIFISLVPNIKVKNYVFLFMCILLESLFLVLRVNIPDAHIERLK